VVELNMNPLQGTMKLRANPDGSGAGYDVTVRTDPPQVFLLRVGEHDEASGPPFEVFDADAVKLQTLYDKLITAAGDLSRSRRALIDATIDGQPIKQHDEPIELVERLIASMAPVVTEIAWRSLSPNELVLKRLLSDDRREEIFVAKADLKKKIDALPDPLRRMFEPLGLNGVGPSHAAEPAVAPRRPRTIPPAPLPRRPLASPGESFSSTPPAGIPPVPSVPAPESQRETIATAAAGPGATTGEVAPKP